MSLWNTLSSWFVHDTQPNLYLPIPYSHIKHPRFQPLALKAEEHYLRLYLSEMALKQDRKWFATWYPAVHSLVTCQFGDHIAEFPYIAGNLTLPEITPTNLDKVIQFNHPLTNLMPFHGGDVGLSAGLFALKSTDYLASFLQVLGDLGTQINSLPLSLSLNLVKPLIEGVEGLLGVKGGELHLGLHQLFNAAGQGAARLETGYIAVIHSTEQLLDPLQLWIVDDHLRIGPTLEHNQPFNGYTYMLFQITGQETRDDWRNLQTIQGPLSMARDAQIEQKPEVTRWLYRQALLAAENSLELTRAHSISVQYELLRSYETMRDIGLGAVAPDLYDLQHLMDQAISPANALKQGPPPLTDFFD